MESSEQFKKIKKETQDLRRELLKTKAIKQQNMLRERIKNREKFLRIFDQETRVIEKVGTNEDPIWLAVGGMNG